MHTTTRRSDPHLRGAIDTRSTRAIHVVACGLLLASAACVSSFHYEPAAGHPARADTAPSAAPPRITPFEYEPPQPVDEDAMDEMGGTGTDRQQPEPTDRGDGDR